MSNNGEIREANQLIKKEFGLDIYEELINNIDPSDKEWQKNFKKYYGVMKRDEKWQETFFDVFKEFSERKNVNAKRKQSELLCEVLTRVKDKLNKSGTRNTSHVEASFCSKILATIYPDRYPIIDTNVFSKMNLKLKRNGEPEDRIRSDVEEYSKFCERYFDFITKHKEEMQQIRLLFEKMFPECKGYSDIKIIDFFLWKTNIDKDPEILSIFDELK